MFEKFTKRDSEMTREYMKRYSILLATREKQTTATKYH